MASYKPREIKINITANTQQAETGFDRIDRKIRNVMTTTEKMNNKFKNSLRQQQQTISKTIQKLNNESKQTAKTISSISSRMDVLKKKMVATTDPKGIKGIRREMDELEKSSRVLNRTQKNNVKELIQQEKNYNKIKNELQQIENMERKSKENKKQSVNATREERKEQERLQKIENERIKKQDKMLQNIRNIGTSLSSAGQTLMGVGAGTSALIGGAAKNYVSTFEDTSKTLALRNSEMGKTTIDDWNNIMLLASKKSGLNSGEISDIVNSMANTTNLYNTLSQLPIWSELGFATGTSGNSVGDLGAIYSNIAAQNGWKNAQEYADYTALALSEGGGTGEQFIPALNQLEVVGQGFAKNDRFGPMRALSIATALDPNVARSATGLRQTITDIIKKDLPSVLDSMATGYGMTNAEYVNSRVGEMLRWQGTSLEKLGLQNGIHTQKDLEKMPLDTLATLMGLIVYEDSKEIDTPVKIRNKKGEVVGEKSPNEIAKELRTDVTGNQRGLNLLGIMVKALRSGKTEDIIGKFNQGADGQVSQTREKIKESQFGRLGLALNSITTNFMILAARFAPFMAGFLQKMVKWTDKFESLNWEEGFAYGEKLFDIIKQLTILGAGLFVFGKVITTADYLGTALMNVGKVAKYTGEVTTKMKNHELSLLSWFSGGVKKSGTEVAAGATTVAAASKTVGTNMMFLGLKVTALATAIVAAISMISKMVKDFAKFGEGQEYKQGREDAYNGKNTTFGNAYNQMNSTTLTHFFDNLSNKKYGHALADITTLISNPIAAIPSYINAWGATKKNDKNLNWFDKFAVGVNQGFTGISDKFVDKDNKVLDTVLGKIFPDYYFYNKNHDEQKLNKDKYKGGYKEPGLEDAEPYFKDESKNNFDNELDKMLKQLGVGAYDNIFTTPFPEDINEDALYNSIADGTKDGAEKGTEKGVKNALEGYFNVPDTYQLFGMTGLGQLNQYEGFGVKTQGKQTIVNNKNNVNITIKGDKNEIIETLNEYLGTTGALSGATSYSI